MNKTRIITSMVAGMVLLFLTSTASAQFLKNLKNQVKETVRQTVEQRSMEKAGNATNTVIDKASSAAGTEADKVLKGSKHPGTDDNQDATGTTGIDENQNSLSPDMAATSFSDYKSYDFVPGDKIIFQPDLSREADAELPARFSIQKGNAEIQSYEGEKILHLNAGGYVTVTPLMDTESYLPEQFTVEFDMMYENDKDYFASVNDFMVRFYAQGDDNFDGYGLYEFKLHSNEHVVLGKYGTSGQTMPEALKKAVQTNNIWHHIAIYVRKNIAKAYINQYRVFASNNMPTGAARMAIRTDGNYGFKIKNFRLAAGGDDKYNKIVTDGKFITHGILFDVAQATIKTESMGTINEVAKLMQDHPDLNFEIQGHTDSDGAEDANLELSQRRADAVKAKLMEAGIAENRLTAKGLGESQPMDSNDTAEGKANNRRVEFVKM